MIYTSVDKTLYAIIGSTVQNKAKTKLTLIDYIMIYYPLQMNEVSLCCDRL